ncbi:MAG: DNRLRE domain-containing protein [Candidatus Pacearchaeota archaeon]
MSRKLEKLLITAGLVASLFLNCSKDVVTNPTPTPTPTPTPKNSAPVIMSSPLTLITENQLYSYQAKASDADGDQITYSPVKNPSWISMNSNGLISGNAPDVFSDQISEIEWSASDGKNPAVSQKYNLTVKNLYNVYVLTPSQINSILSVNENNIAFSQPIGFAPGDIIASDINNSAPAGFLRKINSTSSDKKTAYTSQAALEEAVKDANFYFQKKITPLSVSLNSDVIYDFDGSSSTTWDRLIADGKISFDVEIVLQGKIENYSLEELIFKIISTEECDLTLKSGISGQFTEYIPIGEPISLPPVTIGVIPSPPYLPITVHPKIEFGLEFAGGINLGEVGAIQKAVFTVGLKYDRGQWSPIANWQHSFTLKEPSFSSSYFVFKAGGGPSLKFPVWGVAGPKVKVLGGLEAQVSSEKVSVYGNFDGTIGVEMKVFKKVLADFNAPLLGYKKLIYEKTKPIANDSLIIQPGPEGKDAFVRYTLWSDGSKSYSGFGDTEELEISRDYVSGHGGEKETLIEIPVSGLPSGATFSSAKLAVYGWVINNYIAAIPKIKISKINDSWSESSVKWDTKPSTDLFSRKDITEGERWHEFDATSLVLDWINGKPNYGISISTEQNESYGKFYSSDNSDASKRPKLIIYYKK